MPRCAERPSLSSQTRTPAIRLSPVTPHEPANTPDTPTTEHKTLKQKLIREMIEYWLNFAYLALMFGAFIQYGRLLLAAHEITSTNYWFAIIEAAILAKIIMIGDVVRLGRGLEHRPLIYPTLYKTAVFALFVAFFKVIEHIVENLWHDRPLLDGLLNASGTGARAVLANALVVLVAFIPFFAMKEMRRTLGEGTLWALFFRNKAL